MFEYCNCSNSIKRIQWVYALSAMHVVSLLHSGCSAEQMLRIFKTQTLFYMLLFQYTYVITKGNSNILRKLIEKSLWGRDEDRAWNHTVPETFPRASLQSAESHTAFIFSPFMRFQTMLWYVQPVPDQPLGK